MRTPARLLSLLLCLGLPGGVVSCGMLRKKPVPAGERVVDDMLHGRRPMGQITMIDADRGFVHVRSPLASVTKPDATLTAKSQSQATITGTLKVSPERKRSLMAADIVQGAPKVGDVVFFKTDEKTVSTAPPPASIDPATAPGAASGSAGGNPPPSTGAAGLPPLGAPSGPPEDIPDFPGLSELPEPVPEPASER